MTDNYDKKKFAARQPKPNRSLPCGCEQKEDVDEASGYFIWITIKMCKQHGGE